MRKLLRTMFIATAAVSAAVAIFVALTLPRRPLQLVDDRPSTHVIGAYHIHSNRSDGTGTVDEIAAAAARAGLRYVILTNHGDATRRPDAPTYRNGVLCIDAVEINSREGRIVALGLSGASPYPLAGAARDVVEDIHRLGGMAVMAHPDSPSPALRWRGGGPAVPFDGVEWINADAEWRDDPIGRLLLTAARSALRPAESIATLFARPTRTLDRWDAMNRPRSVFGLAAIDAHARIGGRDEDGPDGRFTLIRRPSYETMFRLLGQVAVLNSPLSGDATRDAELVLTAITRGRTYSVVRALAEPGVMAFAGERDHVRIESGDRIAFDVERPATLRAVTETAPGAALAMYGNGHVVARGIGQVTHVVREPGVYRVEATLPGMTMPWLVSNPITLDDLDSPGDRRRERPSPPVSQESHPISRSPDRWGTEHAPSSQGDVRFQDARVWFDFRLDGGVARGQYAALVSPVQESAGIDRLSFLGAAIRPMRVSVQVRLPGGQDGRRWRRSVYLDQTPRSITLRLQEFEPADTPTSSRPIVAPIQSLLFVVDTVNAHPGTSGSFWIADVELGIDQLDR